MQTARPSLDLVQSAIELNLMFVAVPLLLLLVVSVFLVVSPRSWAVMVGVEDARRNHMMDGVRGLLTLWVLTHHLNVMTVLHQPGAKWVAGAGAVNDLLTSGFFIAPFFMLTGMLFSGGLLASGGQLSTARFLRNRVFRLVPAYIVSLAIVFAAVLYMTGFTLREPLFELIKDVVRWGSFGFLPRYDINTAPVWTWHGMLWTLPYEIAFYAFLPLGAWLQRRTGSPLALIGAIACIGVFATPFIFFAAGAVAAAAVGWRHRLAPQIWRVTSVAALILLGVTAPYSGPVMQAALLIPIAVAVALQLDIFAFLRWRALRFTGEMSYSIYMLHFPLISILYVLVVDPQAVNGLGFVERMLLLAIEGSGILALSALSFIFVERPCRQLGEHAGRHMLTMRFMISAWLARPPANQSGQLAKSSANEER